MTWTANEKLDATTAQYMVAHKDSPIWAVEFLNNSTDILPNTTIHYVVEDHHSDPINALRKLDAFLESAIYPVVLILVESITPEISQVVSKVANSLDITVGTVMRPGGEYTDQSVYSNVLRCVCICYLLYLFECPLFVSSTFVASPFVPLTLCLSRTLSLSLSRLIPQLILDKP